MQSINNNRTIVQVSNDVETYIRYGDENMFKGEFEQAVTNYNKAISYQSDSERAWHSKANALEALGKYDEALKCYDIALNCDDGDAECWFNKGIMLEKLGRAKDGKACIDTGINMAMGSG